MDITERQARLTRMKRAALALLLAMIGVYVIAGIYEPGHPWLGYVRAFAEAGTVGALADWFAVTALFRHPLGIPIPHTAIIQHRKNDIGATLSRFVEENFLISAALKPRLDDMRFSDAIAKWIDKPKNAERLAQDIANLMGRVVDAGDNRELRDLVKDSLRKALSNTEVTPLIGQIIEVLLLKDPDQTLVNGLLGLARQQLEENRYSLRERISDRSPWWLPKFVDQKIYERIVEELEVMLEDAQNEDETEARQRVVETLTAIVQSLKTDPELISQGEVLKEQLLSHPVLQRYLSTLVGDLNDYLSSSLSDPESDIRKRLLRAASALGENLRTHPSLAAEVDLWCRDAVLYVVERYSDSIASVISETVKGWDAEATAQRVELQVGRDLQFIRINGTLVGGLVGLTLYTVWNMFS